MKLIGFKKGSRTFAVLQPSARSRYRRHRLLFTWGCVPHRSRVYPLSGNPA